MRNFRRRRYAVENSDQVFSRVNSERSREVVTIGPMLEASEVPDAETGPASAVTASDETTPVDPTPATFVQGEDDAEFDAAIASVFMALHAERSDELDDSEESADDEHGHGITARDVEGDQAASAPDPDVIRAAETATIRLLGELDRLWQRAA